LATLGTGSAVTSTDDSSSDRKDNCMTIKKHDQETNNNDKTVRKRLGVISIHEHVL